VATQPGLQADALIADGQTDFSGGQDASKIASRISPQSIAAGVNITLARGVPAPPFGVSKRRIKFPTGGITNPISNVTVAYEEIFYAGRFQSFIP